jgi:hypothetical protein
MIIYKKLIMLFVLISILIEGLLTLFTGAMYFIFTKGKFPVAQKLFTYYETLK